MAPPCSTLWAWACVQQGGGQALQDGVGDQPDGVGDRVRLAPGVQARDGEAAVGAQLDRDVRPGRPQLAQQAAQHQHDEAAAVDVARAQDGGDQVAGVAVEDQQRVVHVLAVVAVVGHPFLLAVGRVVGPVEVQQDPGGRAGAATLAEVQVDQRLGEPLDGVPIDRVLQPREGRLAGQVRLARGQPPAGQLEQRVRAQRVGVVLVFVAAGDLEHPLADQRLQAVAHPAAAPLRDARRQRRAHPQRRARPRASQGSPPSLVSCPPSNCTPRLTSSCQNRKPTPDPVAVAHSHIEAPSAVGSARGSCSRGCRAPRDVPCRIPEWSRERQRRLCGRRTRGRPSRSTVEGRARHGRDRHALTGPQRFQPALRHRRRRETVPGARAAWIASHDRIDPIL